MRSLRLIRLTLLAVSSFTLLTGQSFEVVSIRPAPPYSPGVSTALQGGPGTEDPTHIRWNFVTLMNMIDVAFAARPYQVHGPAFLDTEIFNVAATVPAGATKEQVRAMWRKLLSERFGMAARIEKREFDGQELVVSRQGPKLQESKLTEDEILAKPVIENGSLEGPGIAASYRNVNGVQTAKVMANAQPISAVVNLLTDELKQPILDGTGLKGKYDFEFDYAPRAQRGRVGGRDLSTDGDLDIVEAIESHLGLQLRKAKVSLDYVIVGGINRAPTEN
jgi:uncharacterized protein (TIGR03435 family)